MYTKEQIIKALLKTFVRVEDDEIDFTTEMTEKDDIIDHFFKNLDN